MEKDLLSQFMNSKGPKKFDRKAFNKLPEEEKNKLRDKIYIVRNKPIEKYLNNTNCLRTNIFIYKNM